MALNWSELKAKASHRLAMHLPVDSVRLPSQSPTVSFTFDDLPKSAATTGAAMLETYGASGTFYVSGSLVGTKSPEWTHVSGDDILDLHERGHEIGCHTFFHRRVCDLDAQSLNDEMEQNRRYVRALDPGIKIENFAYPFGYGAFVRKRQLQTAFKSCRSIMPGVNRGNVDLQFLRAYPLIDGRIDRDGIDRAFDVAEKTKGWLIFFSHDVADRPSPYGCSPALLNHALDAASRRNIQILSMAEALKCIAPKRSSPQSINAMTTESRSHARL